MSGQKQTSNCLGEIYSYLLDHFSVLKFSCECIYAYIYFISTYIKALTQATKSFWRVTIPKITRMPCVYLRVDKYIHLCKYPLSCVCTCEYIYVCRLYTHVSALTTEWIFTPDISVKHLLLEMPQGHWGKCITCFYLEINYILNSLNYLHKKIFGLLNCQLSYRYYSVSS